MKDGWYYGIDDTDVGPIGFHDLLAFLRARKDWQRIPVWREGYDGWRPAQDVSEVAAALERQARAVDRSILDLSGDLRAALQEREREQRQEQERRQAIEAVKPLAASGMAEFRRQFELHRQAEAGKERVRQEFQAEQARQAAERAEQARQEALRQQELQRQLEQQREAERQRAQQRRQDGPSWSR